MTQLESPAHHTPEPRGEVRFIQEHTRARQLDSRERSGWLVVSLPTLGPASRDRLADAIEQAIERAIARRGAAAPGLGATASSEALLRDQIYRAGQADIRGLIIFLGPLSALVTRAGALGDEDSATLRLFFSAARHMPVALWLDPSDVGLLVHPAPVPLHQVVPTAVDAAASDGVATDASHPEAAPAPRPAGSPASSQWRSHMRALDDAHGPKPLSAIEKLFVERYAPLHEALITGQADDRARQTLERFDLSFEKSYSEAFAALKVTRKRPSMVLDVPQLASRAARLHGARHVALVLVDGLRFDVAGRVQQLLRTSLGGRAVLAEQLLLWAALPSGTPTQLHLLARGVQGLAEAVDEKELAEREMLVPRGKNASLLRRMRIGGREIHKLDALRPYLLESGPPEAERIETLAQAVAQPIARFAEDQAPQTLVFVFGDHGFVLPRTETDTGPAIEGGAMPFQVLVPAQAWLLGRVH